MKVVYHSLSNSQTSIGSAPTVETSGALCAPVYLEGGLLALILARVIEPAENMYVDEVSWRQMAEYSSHITVFVSPFSYSNECTRRTTWYQCLHHGNAGVEKSCKQLGQHIRVAYMCRRVWLNFVYYLCERIRSQCICSRYAYFTLLNYCGSWWYTFSTVLCITE